MKKIFFMCAAACLIGLCGCNGGTKQTEVVADEQTDSLVLSVRDKALLDSIDGIDGVVKCASGLRYRIIVEGDGAQPTVESSIVVAYRGLHDDGTPFWISEDEGEEFALKGTIAGFSEGVGMMHVGSEYVLYIPSTLGYGSKGYPDLIAPDEPLAYEVKLLEVK